MQSTVPKLVALCCLIFSAVADQPLTLKWRFEHPFPSASSPWDGYSRRLHVHDPQSLTFIYQSRSDAVVIDRLTSTGSQVWHREFQFLTNGGFFLRGSAVTPAGKIILAGTREGSGVGDASEDAHVIQLDASGNEEWRHRFVDGLERNFAQQLFVDNQNNVYLGASKNWEFFVAKLSSSGSLLWETNLPSINGNSNGGAYSLALHPNGGLYAVDRNRLIRLTTEGEVVWEKPTPAIQDTIRIGPSGALFLGMRFASNNDPQPLSKFDPDGNHLWTGFGGDDFAILADERYLVASGGVSVGKADGSGVDDVLNGLIGSVSEVVKTADKRLFVSGWDGILELRPDLSRLAFYPETNDRYNPDSVVSIASDGTNVYRFGVYRSTNNVLWAELRAWGPTNSAALPNIVEHPNGATIVAGENFTTSVRAAATPPEFGLSYQWFEWTWQSYYAIPGATNATLHLTNLQPESLSIARPRTFSVRVSNSLGTIYSGEADVWVHTVPNAKNPPSATPSLAYEGDRVEWRVTATATPPLHIQWYKDSAPIPGANASSYIITNVGPEHLGQYGFSLSNAVGQSTSPQTPFTNFLTNASIDELGQLPGSALALPLLRNDGAGNIIAVNTRPLASGSELVISKLDSSGRLIWSTNANFRGNSVNTTPADVHQSLAFNSAGDLLLAGSSPGQSTPRVPAILRLSANGDILGEMTIATPISRITNLKVASSGDIFVSGVLQEGSAYYVLICLTPAGQERWSRRVPATVPFATMQLTAPTEFDSAGNILFAAPGARQIYSFNSQGSTNWSTPLHGFTAFDLERAPDGTFYLSGLDTNRPALMRITDRGARNFRYLPHLSTAIGTDLQIDPAGAIYYLAATSASAGVRPTLSRLHTNGTPVWCASFFSEVEPAFSFAKDSILVASSHSRMQEAGVMKLDTNGVRRWIRSVPFGGQPMLALANDSVVFATAFTGTLNIPLFRIEDREAAEIREAAAVITQFVQNSSPHLLVSAVNAELQRVRWSRSTTSVQNGVGHGQVLQISYASPFSGWLAEVTIPGAVLVTPDFFPVPTPILLTPRRPETGGYGIGVHGRPNTQFILESSVDLRTWSYYTDGYIDQTASSTVTVNPPQLQQFFRVMYR
ncbi:MAG TPA: hypothetical protein VF773_13895 [Verrucomicrobiae bacterium]